MTVFLNRRLVHPAKVLCMDQVYTEFIASAGLVYSIVQALPMFHPPLHYGNFILRRHPTTDEGSRKHARYDKWLFADVLK